MPHPERVAEPLLGSPDGLGFFTSLAALAAASLDAQRAQPMTIDKPSRNEDEYFVKQDAELLRKQRARGRGGRTARRSGRPTT